MTDAIQARAGVVMAEEVARSGSSASWHLRANGSCQMGLGLVVLPPGRRAAELGRSILSNGPAQRIDADVPNWVAELLFWAGRERYDGGERLPGPIDVPVQVDAGGTVTGLDTDALVAELTPMRDEGVRLWKANESPLSSVRKVVSAPRYIVRFASSWVRDWKGAIDDFKTPERPAGAERPDDQSHPPIEGVPYEHWIQVKAWLVRDEVHPAHVDLFTRYRNIPWQRWTAIDAAWSQRADADPALKAWVDYDFGRMKPTGAVWENGY